MGASGVRKPVHDLPPQGDPAPGRGTHRRGHRHRRRAGRANGLSLCSIHHRAFDEDLVGISSDYEVRVHPRLLDDEDGPMLDLLKGAHQSTIVLPRSSRSRPDRELLAVLFERFIGA